MHYFADDITLLFLVRIAVGVASRIMIPAMIAYTYEANIEEKRAAIVISFHVLGWLAGIAASGFASDLKILFMMSAASFAIGLIFTVKMSNPLQEKEIESGTKNHFKK